MRPLLLLLCCLAAASARSQAREVRCKARMPVSCTACFQDPKSRFLSPRPHARRAAGCRGDGGAPDRRRVRVCKERAQRRGPLGLLGGLSPPLCVVVRHSCAGALPTCCASQCTQCHAIRRTCGIRLAAHSPPRTARPSRCPPLQAVAARDRDPQRPRRPQRAAQVLHPHWWVLPKAGAQLSSLPAGVPLNLPLGLPPRHARTTQLVGSGRAPLARLGEQSTEDPPSLPPSLHPCAQATASRRRCAPCAPGAGPPTPLLVQT